MRGLLNWAMHDASQGVFPPFPVNGSGSIVAHVPHESGSAWFMGSSYQPDQQPERSDRDNHLRNFEHLQTLLPTLASTLQTSFASDELSVWKGTRCVTVDRLPLVGPIDASTHPSLWLCAGMGSRGMSFSVLCAELLAARMGAEPLPIEARLAKSLNALRA
jgi:tRNA 5-methylaminomethyl-2-thiouridine biosynthesis bifunctional protein